MLTFWVMSILVGVVLKKTPNSDSALYCVCLEWKQVIFEQDDFCFGKKWSINYYLEFKTEQSS